MLIVDAQVHIWGGGAPSGHHRPVPVFTAEELLAEMDAAGVDAVVGMAIYTGRLDLGNP